MEPPASFVCPITHELMRDPFTTADGQSYEGAAIREWLKESALSPLTGAQLPNKNLTRNHALRNAIEEFSTQQSKPAASQSSLGHIARTSGAHKLILLGDSGVGKTSILQRFKEGDFNSKVSATIGCSFCPHTVQLPSGGEVLFHIWDTAGHEKYRSFTRQYFRDASAALVVFDTTSIPSFLNAQAWIEELRQETADGPPVTVALAGNKSDLTAERQVAAGDAQGYAAQQGLLFVEVSAKAGTNVEALFGRVAALVDQAPASRLSGRPGSKRPLLITDRKSVV